MERTSEENFLIAIGRLTVWWSHLEAGLDLLVLLCFSGSDLRPKPGDLPIALGKN